MGRPQTNQRGEEDYDVADFYDFDGEGAFGSEPLPCCEVDEDGLDSDLIE
ncbi:hypothetical protein [Pacificimonas flava]|uniref:Uncharacterized protein n=1 Tax=Pacificimonas flava TaxID=1234595 RepID=M2TM01_9SPHN|nr:hypothetical protein [Pacificimonas flava]EMD82761.1 hypothetical protein C725_1801 [Pacificimonas flava]MBB5279379.1 hypothetical protein [Pacificimonas flava]